MSYKSLHFLQCRTQKTLNKLMLALFYFIKVHHIPNLFNYYPHFTVGNWNEQRECTRSHSCCKSLDFNLDLFDLQIWAASLSQEVLLCPRREGQSPEALGMKGLRHKVGSAPKPCGDFSSLWQFYPLSTSFPRVLLTSGPSRISWPWKPTRPLLRQAFPDGNTKPGLQSRPMPCWLLIKAFVPCPITVF